MSNIERPRRALAPTRSTGISANDRYLNLAEHPKFLTAVAAVGTGLPLVGGTGSATSCRVHHNLGAFSSRVEGLATLVARGAGTVQGFSFFGGRLIPLWGSNRSLGLSNTSPPFFLDSPGQVGFTPDGQQLILTTKNSGSNIDIYSVGKFGYLSDQPTVNSQRGRGPGPFCIHFRRGRQLNRHGSWCE